MLLSVLVPAASLAAPVWVSDQFEVTLRTGPSTSNAIERVLVSGRQLEELERDSDTGYSRVRTIGGTEGWVLTRYLMDEPSAREQLQKLTADLTNANERGTDLGGQLSAIKGEYDTATNRISALESENSDLQSELAEIKRTAANVLAIDSQNKTLRQQLTDAEIQVSILEQENEDLAGQSTRNWFLAGALVLFIGIILGLWLPRIRFQRRSGYDRF